MRLLTPKGYLIEEQGMSYLTDTDPEAALRPLQAAACTYRIALGPRGGQKVLSLQTVPSQTAPPTQQRCVSEQGFSLHAEVCCAAHQRHKPESQGQGRVPERQRGCVRTLAKQAGSGRGRRRSCWARRGRSICAATSPARPWLTSGLTQSRRRCRAATQDGLPRRHHAYCDVPA